VISEISAPKNKKAWLPCHAEHFKKRTGFAFRISSNLFFHGHVPGKNTLTRHCFPQKTGEIRAAARFSLAKKTQRSGFLPA